MTKQFENAVYIGRFQPPHREHIATIQGGLNIADRVVVVIGSAHKPRSPRNPWTAPEREEMIRLCFSFEENTQLRFVYLEDSLYNDSFWAANLQNLLNLDNKQVALLGYKKDASSYYLDMFPQWTFVSHKPEVGELNATDIRSNLFEQNTIPRKALVCEPVADQLRRYVADKDFFDFMVKEFAYIRNYKKSWSTAPFPPIFVTTDAVVIRSSHVLVVKRGQHPGKNLLALPGGFVNQGELLVDGCLRELKEETKIEVPRDTLKMAVKKNGVFDHPQRSQRGRTISHAFLIDLGNGLLPTVRAGDDASEAFWMPLADIYRNREAFFEDHLSIIHSLTAGL